MFRQSSSRNSRTKGIRVKHVLQICLLLGVCFWLIYQVKRSHDKKKGFVENGVRVSAKIETGNDVLRFGRKELIPRSEKLTEKREKEEEEEEAGGEDQILSDKIDAAENEKPEEETEEEDVDEEESKNGEGEDIDEIDEHDQEKADGIDDFVDEDKARDTMNDQKDDELTKREEKEAQGHEEIGRNTHEAREEQYNGDDASSAVAHDTRFIITETENLSSDGDRKDSSLTVSEGLMDGSADLNVTARDENVNNEESFHPNSTMTTELQLRPSNESTRASTERSNNATPATTVTEFASLQNGTETLSEIKLQNATVNLPTDSISALPSRTENLDSPAEFMNSSSHSSSNTTVEAENISSGSSTNSDTIKQSGEANEDSGSSSNENANADQHEHLVSSIARDEANPESKPEDDNNGNAAAE